ncbi:MAG TPA: hypothetical protein VFW95_06275 [Candidatus Limnocylindria bacterium]|nr:hypothetical protein [Candidatus Limnocylindria bacterium]
MTERTGSGGGMTGATGDLTPDENPDELVTGERREIEGPTGQAAVTHLQAGDPPEDEGPTDLGTREGPEPQSDTRIGGDEASEGEERF